MNYENRSGYILFEIESSSKANKFVVDFTIKSFNTFKLPETFKEMNNKLTIIKFLLSNIKLCHYIYKNTSYITNTEIDQRHFLSI